MVIYIMEFFFTSYCLYILLPLGSFMNIFSIAFLMSYYLLWIILYIIILLVDIALIVIQ